MSEWLYCRSPDRSISRNSPKIPYQCCKNQACPACQRLAEIDRKIGEAHQVLTYLLDDREKLAPVFNNYHDPVVRPLPVEITSHIFEHCKPFCTIRFYL